MLSAHIVGRLLRLLRNRNGKSFSSSLWPVLAVCIVWASAASLAQAQTNLYTVNHEWAQIFINDDGTIDLTYNISLTVTQGRLTAFDVGQPNRDFTIGTSQ